MESDNHSQRVIHPEDAVWQDAASCKGSTDMMFPGHYKDISYIGPARRMCNGSPKDGIAACPVKVQCEAYALSFPAADMHGVWAGMTPRQLARRQHELSIQATKPTLAQIWQEAHKANQVGA
jgi:hypothetical protein